MLSVDSDQAVRGDEVEDRETLVEPSGGVTNVVVVVTGAPWVVDPAPPAITNKSCYFEPRVQDSQRGDGDQRGRHASPHSCLRRPGPHDVQCGDSDRRLGDRTPAIPTRRGTPGMRFTRMDAPVVVCDRRQHNGQWVRWSVRNRRRSTWHLRVNDLARAVRWGIAHGHRFGVYDRRSEFHAALG